MSSLVRNAAWAALALWIVAIEAFFIARLSFAFYDAHEDAIRRALGATPTRPAQAPRSRPVL